MALRYNPGKTNENDMDENSSELSQTDSASSILPLTPSDNQSLSDRAQYTAGPEEFDKLASLRDPQRYTVMRSISDMFEAIRANLSAYIMSIIFSVLAAFVGVGVTIAPVVTVFFSLAHKETISTGTITTLIVGAILLAIVWLAIAGTFILTYVAVVLDAGANGRTTGIGKTFRVSMSRLKRVLGAYLFLVGVAIGPLILAAFLTVFTSTFAKMAGIVSALALLAAVIWIYVAMLRYLLAPYIAIFEPEVALSGVMSRSRKLMKNGGQWFILKEVGAILLGMALISFATGSFAKGSYGNNAWVDISGFVVSLIVIGTIVMLYRNRRLVRG
jgi:hypothetical protein